MAEEKDRITIADLFDAEQIPEYLRSIFAGKTYPWEVLPEIRDLAGALIRDGIEGFTYLNEHVLIGPDVRIAPNVVFEGNCIIGAGTEIRPGAYLRGNVITGPDCVIGNSSELKNCLLLRHVQVPHYNYVGDSVLGSFSHMGAGSICSNLKSDGKNIVIHGIAQYETGLRKIGAILGDHADVGCSCVLNPGTVIGKNSRIYPLTSVRGVVGADRIMKNIETVVVKENR